MLSFSEGEKERIQLIMNISVTNNGLPKKTNKFGWWYASPC